MSLGLIVTKMVIGLVVLLVVGLGVWNVANAAFNSECGFGISTTNCARESYEGSNGLSVDLRSTGSSGSSSSSTDPISTAINCEAEVYGLIVNGVVASRTGGAILLKDGINRVIFRRNVDNSRNCRLTLMNDESLYRESSSSGLTSFGWTQDCKEEFVFTFNNGLKTNISGSLILDSMIFCPNIGDDGIGQQDLWAASEKIPVTLGNAEDVVVEDEDHDIPTNTELMQFQEQLTECINSEDSKCYCNITTVPDNFKIHTTIGVKSLTAQTLITSELSGKGLIYDNNNYELPEFNLCLFPTIFPGPYYNDIYLLVQGTGNFITRDTHTARVFPYVIFERENDGYKIMSPTYAVCFEGICEGEYSGQFKTGLKFYKPPQKYFELAKDAPLPSAREIEIDPSLQAGWHSGSSRTRYHRVEYPEDNGTVPTLCVLNFEPRYNNVCE